MSFIDRKKIAKAKKRARSLGVPTKNIKKSFKSDKIMKDIAFALTVSFAAQVKDNKHIDKDELIMMIAEHVMGVFQNYDIVYADNEGMKRIISRKIEPMLMSTSSSASMMLVSLIEYLVADAEYPVAVKAFSKIIEEVKTMRHYMETNYLDEYKKQQSLLMFILGEEPNMPYNIVRSLRKYKSFIARGTLTKEMYDDIEAKIKRMNKLCIWGDVKFKDPDMLFVVFLVLEKFKDDLDSQTKFIRNAMNPISVNVKDKNMAVNILADIYNKNLKGDLSAQIILSLDCEEVSTDNFLAHCMEREWCEEVNIDQIISDTYVRVSETELNNYLSSMPDYYVEINEYNKNNILDDIRDKTLDEFKKLIRTHKTIKKARESWKK